MVETTYLVDGMTCGSCAMQIEQAVQELDEIQEAHMAFKTRVLTVKSEKLIERQRLVETLTKLGHYTLKDASEKKEPAIYSIFVFGILGAIFILLIFYLVQALGMQSSTAPIAFMRENKYLVVPLILGFGVQSGLFRAIHLLTQHGGGGVIAGSGSVSGGTMFACCLHNLVPLFPIIGVSGLATFFTAYQTPIFLFSIGVTFMGVGYMIHKYSSIKRACKVHANHS